MFHGMLRSRFGSAPIQSPGSIQADVRDGCALEKFAHFFMNGPNFAPYLSDRGE